MKPHEYDLAVIGGGVNGCGVARDAAGRGLSVFLCEQGDLAGATSSASTKLIHGGLRYLEYYEFRLVREALIERERLLRAAPHIIWPLRFVLPHHDALRPAWLIRLGLFLYDHLGGRELLPGTRSIDLTSDAVGAPLKDDFTKGFEYSDCWVEDSRLVVLNAIDAREKGAEVVTRTRMTSAARDGDRWRVTVEDRDSGETREILARAVVNAAGPWVADVLTGRFRINSPARVRMVKGSHVIVPRMFDHDRAYIFQNPDKRIIFAIPYETDFTLIGTTDEDFQGDPADVRIAESEVDYLCRAASAYFKQDVRKDDIVHTFSGVRPLYDDNASDASAATRDYVIEVDGGEGGGAPLVSVFGGKITTFRKLAEAVMAKLSATFPDMAPPWTDGATMPGGDFGVDEVERKIATLARDYPFLDNVTARRLVRAYGTRAWTMLDDARAAADMGQSFGAGLTAREVTYLMDVEWAKGADDVLWRRSKLGLRLDADQRARLQDWMNAQTTGAQKTPELRRGGAA
ncbi:Aerobic glycerol-3-phosphate dehydrogenase [Caenispirillum salinarum AK4]|uniref:Glycerol-3-phosphate dehydrogenase n=1 Tax=Caenispirillum salinarum AK4 TaxID=1238182 RepID=K9HFA1_9PROT|nr:glycerol-3-phosphate dehydrogenase [Caenispirillum salinarum]EKV27361.1 Aerobic glycerol-3-phosphate dehydrogenase [Caenispirillum salinarum AK4]